jgi:hypothetical protein
VCVGIFVLLGMPYYSIYAWWNNQIIMIEGTVAAIG